MEKGKDHLILSADDEIYDKTRDVNDNLKSLLRRAKMSKSEEK